MKASVTALALLVASATAILSLHNIHQHHHAHKRDVVMITETKYVMETQIAYQTAYVYPDGSPVSSIRAVQPVAPSHAAVPAVHSARSSVDRVPPPQQTRYSAPAPSVAQSSKAPAAPQVVPPAPVAHTAPAAAPAPHVAPQPAVPAPAAPAPALAPASSSSTTGTFTGQMTYYAVGLGSCGLTSIPSDYIVAIPVSQMENPANPNANPLCGKSVTIHYGGKTATAKIVDTCEGCKSGDLDMSTSLFSYFAPMFEGRVSGMSWSIDG